MPYGSTGEYRSRERYPSSPMCVITLRIFVSKPTPAQRKTITASQTISTPLIEINVPRAPDKIALPVHYTRQPQIQQEIPPASPPEQCSAPPAVSAAAAATPIPDSSPAGPPPNKEKPEKPEQENRRSSIRRAAQKPSSSGSGPSKRVHFSISEFGDSLDSSDSDIASLDPPLPAEASLDTSGTIAMAIENKPTAQAPPSGEEDNWESLSDFSSDIDDGEMVQQAVGRETQTNYNYLYKADWDDMDSDSGSAVDGSEPALAVPLTRDATSKSFFAQHFVSNGHHKGSAPPGYPIHQKLGGQPDIAAKIENQSPRLSGQTLSTKAHLPPSVRQSMHPSSWENDSEAGSTMDDNVPAIRVPLTSYTSDHSRPIHLRAGTVPFTAPGASESTPQDAKGHGPLPNEGQKFRIFRPDHLLTL